MTNIKKLQKALPPELDAILLRDPLNRRYVTGFASSAGFALISRRDAFFVTDSRYIEAAQGTIKDAQVGLSCYEKPEKQWLLGLLKDLSVAKLGIEEQSMSHGEFLRLDALLPAELIPAQSVLQKLRAQKSPQELQAMKQAQAIAEKAFEEVLALIRPGISEKRLAAELTYRMLLHGGEGNSFDPIVVSGSNSSMPHGVPGDKCIEAGDFITMDFGCIKNGYCSDMTRTVAVGYATEEMVRVYDTVLEAQKAGIAAARPGVPGKAVDAAARKLIADAGYGDCFGHGFGHSLGLEVHEGPNASPSEEQLLPEGAVISAEPGIYLPGKFGVRIEDVLYLTGDGCENLTAAPKNLIIL